jgi:uncharacterized membrane protein
MKSNYNSFGTAATVAAGALFAALVAAITYLIPIPIPATNGYFNFGETIIYSAALILGPFVGSFAGGGAAIADLLVPTAAIYAPATLVLKAVEGFTVGFLNIKLKKKTNLTVSAVISVLIGGMIMIVGYFAYQVLALGFPLGAALVELPFNIVQMVVGLAVALPIMYAVLRVFPQLKSQI